MSPRRILSNIVFNLHRLDNLKPTMLSLPQVFLEQRETNLEGQDKTKFLQLMRKMLKWDPIKRSSMEELLQDEWIRKELED